MATVTEDDGATVPGQDLVIRPPVDPHKHLWFAGNTWNHAPPTQDSRTNGGDLDVVAGAVLDLRDATAFTRACTTGVP